MTKQELISKIAAAAGITKVQAKAALEAATGAITDALVANESVQLLGFGTFKVSVRPGREGKNPRTGEKISIPEKKVAKFKAATAVDEAINK